MHTLPVAVLWHCYTSLPCFRMFHCHIYDIGQEQGSHDQPLELPVFAAESDELSAAALHSICTALDFEGSYVWPASRPHFPEKQSALYVQLFPFGRLISLFFSFSVSVFLTHFLTDVPPLPVLCDAHPVGVG